MLIKLINLVIFLLFSTFQNANTQDYEYFKKSIFRALKEKNGQFRSKINYTIGAYLLDEKTSYSIEEKYDFKLNSGEFIEERLFKTKYFNSSEIYRIDYRHRDCISKNFNKSFLYLLNWIDRDFYDPNFNYKLLSPSVLLELFENYDETKLDYANPNKFIDENKSVIKCTIAFDDTLLEYYFVNKDEHIMYPKEIIQFKKNETTKEWYEYSKMNYLYFKPTFSNESIVDSKLDVGFGCRRRLLRPQKYPRITNSNYGLNFELNQTVTNEISSDLKELPEIRLRKYSTKITANLNSSIIIANTKNIRTIYNASSKMLYQINLSKNKCEIKNLTLNRKIDWYNVDNLSASEPEIYYFNKSSYSYLGEHKVDGIDCLVFEMREYFVSSNNSLYKSIWEKIAGVRQAPKSIVITHYYPKEKDYWRLGEKSNELSIPRRIEVFLLGFNLRKRELVRLTIDILSFNSFNSSIEKYDTKSDLAKCSAASVSVSKPTLFVIICFILLLISLASLPVVFWLKDKKSN